MGRGGYQIPSGFLFDYITCANYTTELYQWSGFNIATDLDRLSVSWSCSLHHDCLGPSEAQTLEKDFWWQGRVGQVPKEVGDYAPSFVKGEHSIWIDTSNQFLWTSKYYQLVLSSGFVAPWLGRLSTLHVLIPILSPLHCFKHFIEACKLQCIRWYMGNLICIANPLCMLQLVYGFLSSCIRSLSVNQLCSHWAG